MALADLGLQGSWWSAGWRRRRWRLVTVEARPGISIRAECIILVPVRAVDNAGQNGSMAAFWASAAFDQRMVI